jgi:hypothetical protein
MTADLVLSAPNMATEQSSISSLRDHQDNITKLRDCTAGK